eukprot:5216289-Pyramimonas_sp.AAC.1
MAGRSPLGRHQSWRSSYGGVHHQGRHREDAARSDAYEPVQGGAASRPPGGQPLPGSHLAAPLRMRQPARGRADSGYRTRPPARHAEWHPGAGGRRILVAVRRPRKGMASEREQH